MSYFYNISHYHLLRMKEMGKIYWCHSIGALGVSLAAIFIPIYLLKIGLSFTEVITYLLLQQVFTFLLQYTVSSSMQFIKPHHMMVIGNACYVLLFSLLLTMDKNHWPLALLAFIWALNRSCYWTAFHYCFSIAHAHKHSGTQIAGINSLIITATTVAPAIGGVIATFLGINYIYWLAIVLIIIASLPMFVIAKGPARPSLNLTWSLFKKIKRDALANFFNGMVLMTEQSVWPLFIYLIVTSYAGIGLLSSVIALAGIATALYVGKKEELNGEHRYISSGTLTYSISNIGRTIVQNSLQVFGLNLLSGLGRSLYVTAFLTRYYSNSEEDCRLGYVTIMESAFSLGAAAFMAVLLIITVAFSIQTALTAGFLIAAAAVMGVRLIR
jgi:hypothetical protein